MSTEETWDLFLTADEPELASPPPVPAIERRELVAIEPAGQMFEVVDGQVYVRTTMVFRDSFGFEHRRVCLST